MPPPASPTSRVLPDPGTNPVGIAAFVERLALEAISDKRRVIFDRESVDGLNYYLGNQWEGTHPIKGAVLLVLNRVLNCVVAQYAVQAGDPPKVKFTARESGEPPLVFVNTESQAGQELARELADQAAANVRVDPEHQAAAAFDPTKPLHPDVATDVRQAIEQGELLAQQAAMAGQPAPQGYPTKDAIVEVTERTATEALQTVFDGMWDACDAYTTYVENVLNKNCLGYQPTRYEFDDEAKAHVLENVHPRHVFLDPTKALYSKCQYQLYIEPLSESEALAKYRDPEVQKEVRRVAAVGNIRVPAIAGFVPGYPFTHTFQRGMVSLIHLWIRNQPYPMTPEQAVTAGKLIPGSLPTREMTHELDPATNLMMPTPVMRDAHFHPDTGAEATPFLHGTADAHPDWPVRYAIRQITSVGRAVVDDRECEFGNLPIPWNRNTPIPFSPYGQGEPVRLQGLQDALNRALSSVVTQLEYNAFAPEVVRQEVVEAIGDKVLREARSRPGQRIVIPRTVAEALGGDVTKAIAFLETADVPADFWKLLDWLVQMIDREGNQTDVMQGEAAPGWSGTTVAALQGAASQVSRGKSLWTEIYLKDLVRLMVHSIVTRMSPADWSKYCRKCPPQALEALHAKAISLDLNVSVEITSGSGANAQQQTNALIAAGGGRAPVSPQSMLEALGKDPDVEAAQTIKWTQMTQPAAVAPAGMNPAPDAAQQQQPPAA